MGVGSINRESYDTMPILGRLLWLTRMWFEMLTGKLGKLRRPVLKILQRWVSAFWGRYLSFSDTWSSSLLSKWKGVKKVGGFREEGVRNGSTNKIDSGIKRLPSCSFF